MALLACSYRDELPSSRCISSDCWAMPAASTRMPPSSAWRFNLVSTIGAFLIAVSIWCSWSTYGVPGDGRLPRTIRGTCHARMEHSSRRRSTIFRHSNGHESAARWKAGDPSRCEIPRPHRPADPRPRGRGGLWWPPAPADDGAVVLTHTLGWWFVGAAILLLASTAGPSSP